jgi:hypothetical protein
VAERGSFTRANGYRSWKKKTKGALGQAVAGQRDHFGDHVAAVLRLGDQRGEVGGFVDDVGIRQQDHVGIAGGLDPLGDGPQLAAPARRPGAARQHGQARIGDGARDGAGAVGAGIVDQDDAEGGMVLGEQRGQGGGDGCGLVAGGDDDGDEGRGSGSGGGAKHGARLPEAAVEQQQMDPDRGGEDDENAHAASMPTWRNQATASATATAAGRGA